MSIVCGLVANGTLYVGSDTQVRISGTRYDMRKIRVLPQAQGTTWVVGVAGDMRAVNALASIYPAGGTVITEIVRYVKEACAPLAPKSSGDPWPFEMVVGSVQAGCPPRLWVVSNTMTHTEILPGRLAAVGAGMQAALGAWTVCCKDVALAILAPIDAAISVSALCGGNRDLVMLRGGEPVQWLD